MRVARNLKLHWRRLTNARTISLHGVTIGTDAGEVPRSVRSALFKETYEDFECALVRKHVQPGDRVLEIGTGIGLVSLVATSRAGKGHVHSFEANPAMETLIRANYARNGAEPQLQMKAVTSDGRDLSFNVDADVLSSSLHAREKPLKQVTVPSIAINEAIEKVQPTVILMDVEGAEAELLPIAELAGVDRMIIELHPHIIGESEVASLIDGLAAKGFRTGAQMHKTYLFQR